MAILSLAPAIGANTAIFSLLNALVFRSLPVADPGTLIQLETYGRGFDGAGVSFPAFEAIARRQQVCSAFIGWWGDGIFNVEANGGLARADIWAVTGNFYAELGVSPFAGRLLGPSDMDLAARTFEPVAVVGYGFWRRQLGGDPGVIGRTVRVERAPFTVVGIAPKGFTGLGLVSEPDVTIPIVAEPVITARTTAALGNLKSPWVSVTGRLKPGVTLEQARAQLQAIWPGVLAATAPPDYAGAERDDFLATRLTVESGAHGTEWHLRTHFTRPLYVVLGIAGLILLIACVNLASLMLSRAAARSHEMAVRLALGAGRWRLVRQMVGEGLLLSGIGAALGLAFAYWSGSAIAGFMLRDYLVPSSLDVAPDLHVIAFAAAAAVAGGVLFSVVPAWRAARSDPGARLQQGGRGLAATGRAGRALVVAQVALSLVLLMDAGLLVRTLRALRATDPGYATDRLAIGLFPRPDGYRDINDQAYYPELVQRVASLPGVRDASLSHIRPGGGSSWMKPVGRTDAVHADMAEASFALVSPSFFRTLDIALLRGRDFAWSDDDRGPRVAIVSRTLAGRLFPRGDAVGSRLRIGGGEPGDRDVEIVGVAADARLYDLRSANRVAVYVPIMQAGRYAQGSSLIVDARSNPAAVVAAVRGVLAALGRESILSARSVSHVIDRALLQERITAVLAGFFGGLALLLAAIGLYGVTAYSVARREREIGVRVALGAGRRDIAGLMLRETLRLVGTGVALGIPAALVAARLVSSLVYGLPPRDVITLAGAAALLVAVAACAAYLPARRAARLDPLVSLRAE